MLDSLAIDATSASSFGEYPSTSNVDTFTFNHMSRHAAASQQEDEVTLSTTAKAQLWKHEGLSVAEIASQLGLSVSAIQADLGIVSTTTTQTSATAA